VTGSAVYLGGDFTRIGKTQRNHVAALSPLTGKVLPFRADTNNGVNALVVAGDRLYLGGAFDHLRQQARSGVGAVNIRSGTLLRWNPAPSGEVHAISPTRRGVVIAGAFTGAKGRAVSPIVALDLNGRPILSWRVPVKGYIEALAVSGNTLYVGGDFTAIGGVSRDSVAAVNSVTGEVLDWAPTISGSVNAITPYRGVIYVAGDFAEVDGNDRHNLAAVDVQTGKLTNWQPDLGDSLIGSFSVSAIVGAGDTIYLAGGFDLLEGKAHAPIAAVDRTTGKAQDWNPRFTSDPGPDVHSLTLASNVLYLAGYFDDIDGQPRHKLAAFDINTGKLTPWAPEPSGFSITWPIAMTVAADGTNVYLGGDFNGRPRKGLAIVDAATGALRSWRADAPGVNWTALTPTRLFIGGLFNRVGSTSQSGIAVFPR
jgi:hypothetical protein